MFGQKHGRPTAPTAVQVPGTQASAAPAPTAPRHPPKVIKALTRFAMSITVFNILGYTVLGFEQPWAWPLIALAVSYTLEIGLETIGACVDGRPARYLGGGVKGLMQFLLPAHITALAVNMLTYPNDKILVMLFGIVVAIGAKWVLRVPVHGRLRHYMNPSNFGIAMILVLFPWASIAPPYHFTENVSGPIDWLIPAVIVVGGTMLNAKLTDRMWLIGGWLSFFVMQAVVRGWVFDTAILGALGMMTGTAFVLYTNYMVTDPGTTPSKPLSQFAFGAGVALTYGALTAAHIAYGLFFATAIICLVRGAFLWSLHIMERARVQSDTRDRAQAAVVAAPEPAREAVAAREPVTVGAGIERPDTEVAA